MNQKRENHALTHYNIIMFCCRQKKKKYIIVINQHKFAYFFYKYIKCICQNLNYKMFAHYQVSQVGHTRKYTMCSNGNNLDGYYVDSKTIFWSCENILGWKHLYRVIIIYYWGVYQYKNAIQLV